MAYNLEPRTIKENLLGLIGKNPHAEPRPANTREECFLADIAENGGGSSLPPYTSADVGKALTVGEDADHPIQQTVVPEQSVTLESGGEVNLATFGVDSGVDFDFFENASVGDKCYISIGGADAVESTAENLYGETLFPIGDYYVGYASMFNGTGVASFTETGPVTVSAYAITLPIVADWRDIMFVLNKDFWGSIVGETTELYAMLKAAYDEGATLYIRDTSAHSTGEIYHMDYDADNDKFVAHVSWFSDGSVVELFYGTYTIDPLQSTGQRTGLYKVQMSRL